jgi:hypothetical protein
MTQALRQVVSQTANGQCIQKYSPVNKERLNANCFAKYAPWLKVNERRNVTGQHYCVKEEYK